MKFYFAKEIVERFHGPDAAQNAAREFNARFREGALPEDMPELVFKAPAAGLAITQALKLAGFVPSVSEAQRLIEQGGVRIDGERATDRGLKFTPGTSFVLQAGKRKAARIRIS